MDAHTASINGYRIAYYTRGKASAPPIVLLHGWYSDAAIWRATAEAFAGAFRCVALDLLGAGQSDKPADAAYSAAQQAELVAGLLDHLGIGQTTLIGHSYGGLVALTFAGTYPKRVSKLAAVAPVVTGALGSFRPLMRMMAEIGGLSGFADRLSALARRYPQMAASFIDALYYNPANQTLERTRQHIAAIAHPGTPAAMRRMYFEIKRSDVTPLLPRITAPVLAIWGEQDRVVPVEELRHLRARVPDLRECVLPACAHWPGGDCPDAYFGALRDFLNGDAA